MQRFASVAVLTVVLAVAVVLLLLVNEAGASPSKRLSRFQIEVQSTVVAAYQDPTLIRPLMQRDHITMMLMPEMAEFADAIEHRARRASLRLMDAECFACLTPLSLQVAAVKPWPWARRFLPLTD